MNLLNVRVIYVGSVTTRIGRDADDCLVYVALGELNYLVSPAPTLPPRALAFLAPQLAIRR